MSTSIPSPTHPPETNLGIVTSWLPLTTTYPSQSGCSSDIYARWGITSGYNAVAFDPEYGISVNTSVSCLPAQATTWWDQLGLQDTTSTVISLGPVICPAQYTTIGTSLVGVGSTLVVCCPLAYTFVSLLGAGQVGQCTSSIAKGAIYTYAMLSTPGNDFGGVITTSVTLTSQTWIVGVPINGYNFAIASTTSPTSSSITSLTSSLITSSTSSMASASPITTTTPDNSLSVGAKVGIGIGAGVIALAFGMLFVAFMRMRRKNKTAAQNTPYSSVVTDPMYRKPELEADSSRWGEMEGDSRLMYELDTEHIRGP